MYPEEYTIFEYEYDCNEIDLFEKVEELSEKLESLDWEIVV